MGIFEIINTNIEQYLVGSDDNNRMIRLFEIIHFCYNYGLFLLLFCALKIFKMHFPPA
jgi:hypothetical protein